MKRFEQFSEDLWGYVRLHQNSLDSERMTRLIREKMEDEHQRVSEFLRVQIAEAKKEAEVAEGKLAACQVKVRTMREEMAVAMSNSKPECPSEERGGEA